MKKIILTLTLALVPSAWATTVAYSFNSPTGKLGTSQSYTDDGVTITAYGFENNKSTDLFGNMNGLGLVADGDQISNGFIQLDLENFWAIDPGGVKITVGDVSNGEDWEIFGSNTLGKLGTEIQTGSSSVATSLSLSADNYRYISITAEACSDVVLSGLSGNVTGTPEPGTLAMMGLGVGLLLMSKVKLLKKRSR